MTDIEPAKRLSQDSQEQLAKAVEAEIASGAFRPGDRLDERTLAIRFGVSRTPIREVLRRLASQGIVESRPHQGAFVPTPTVSEILLTYEILGALEALAARLASRRATFSERQQLCATANECLAMAAAGDLNDYARLNLKFHEQIYEMSQNHLLGENTYRIRQKLAPFRRMTFDLPGHMKVSADEHVEIADAIARAQGDEAARLMENHLNINRVDFRDLFVRISRELSDHAAGHAKVLSSPRD
jgi:DNA-binding GntR family transcriptional regulator